MAEMIGRLVKEMHEREGFEVLRPEGNEFLVVPEDDDIMEAVRRVVQRAINTVCRYVRNCPPYLLLEPTGEYQMPACFIVVRPISEDIKQKIVKGLDRLAHSGVCIEKGVDSEGELRIILYTVGEIDRPVPADVKLW